MMLPVAPAARQSSSRQSIKLGISNGNQIKK
jgi:hypothetical protein